ncbi:MAG: hypothetical protein J2P13_03960 [Acidobacteria bacterium]|nr:hypothetical protein [Acidobacteriota bacterium]
MRSNVEVVGVDDNPMVVRVLREALRSPAKLATGAGRDNAPDRARDLPVDGFRTPAIDGRQPADKLRIREPVWRLSVIRVATKAVPEKPVAEDHVASGRRSVDGARPATGGGTGEEEDVLLDS